MFSALPPDGFDMRTHTDLPALATQPIEDGDTLDLGERHFKVTHKPEHSPGLIELWEASSGLQFSGDNRSRGAGEATTFSACARSSVLPDLSAMVDDSRLAVVCSELSCVKSEG